ncbi:hypothetical protein [Novipirellula artificiosorum]|uniref:Uncharacterized protein n=1 Tax=Novipirellula artificiosorum TaxID=2528016 RepID=A0A5C6DJ72_9BACT|nr:hypothetical protein [Novipirellula artificiosorum]TWU35947.1 hypothetical protein Poly41_36990 [Novipirellula artificiosorum]
MSTRIPSMKLPSRAIVAAVLFMLLMPGCQFVPDKVQWPNSLFHKEPDPAVPNRMMVMWTDTVLHQPQQPGVRGFGGRVYFYEGNDPDPVVVDGGLAIYAFDADQINPELAKPERKFVFTADQFAEHMSRTSMGPSYSVWVPWDEVGGVNRQLSLIVRFEGRAGGVVISDPTIKLLPGLSRPVAGSSSVQQATTIEDRSKSTSSTRLASFDGEPSGSGDDRSSSKRPRRKTETIDLPPSFYRHLNGSAAEFPIAVPPQEAAEGSAIDSAAAADVIDASATDHAKHATPATHTAWARYPFRTLGVPLQSKQHTTRQDPLPGGWLKQLPKTPRYGFPNSRTTDAGTFDGESTDF